MPHTAADEYYERGYCPGCGMPLAIDETLCPYCANVAAERPRDTERNLEPVLLDGTHEDVSAER